MPDWKFVSQSQISLTRYPCGVNVGDRLRLRSDLPICDWQGNPTGKVELAGTLYVVVSGSPEEPDVVWLRDGYGDFRTWDESILEHFNVVARGDLGFET